MKLNCSVIKWSLLFLSTLLSFLALLLLIDRQENRSLPKRTIFWSSNLKHGTVSSTDVALGLKVIIIILKTNKLLTVMVRSWLGPSS